MKNVNLAFILIIAILLTLAPTVGYGESVYADDIGVTYNPANEARDTVKNHISEIDISNAKDGYVMVRYLVKTNKAVRVAVKTPGGTSYIYRLKADGKYEAFPVSEGGGYYRITVYENVFDNKYHAVLEAGQDIRLENEFAPFIRPNQYVSYNSKSATTQKAAELTKGVNSTTGKIAAIYNYVIKNISYDNRLADTVEAGYIPDVDKVLQSGRGICFDYAVVTAAMLRSQGIPAKLVVGYRGKDYHAWISTYSNEEGWMDGVLYFDGKSWKTMDPALDAAYGKNGNIWQYMGNEKNYSARYIY